MINQTECTLTSKPLALYERNNLRETTPNTANGLRWRIGRKWVSYRQIKAAIVAGCLMLCFAAPGQRLGKWLLPDGTTIERINDSAQIERIGRYKDTLKIKWIDERNYMVLCPYGNWLRVRIMRPTKYGYKSMITDGKRKRFYYAKAI